MRTAIVLVCLVGAAGVLPAANILPNSSFESWLLGLPVGWLTSELLYPGSAVQDSGSNSGTYCVKLDGGDSVAFVSSVAVVTPGYSYDFSGYARVPGVLGGSFVLLFLTALGDTVGSPELLPVYYSEPEYREYTRSVFAPESAAAVSVSFLALAGMETYIDDVTLDETTFVDIAEPAVSLPAVRQQPRKLLFINGSSSCPTTAVPLFDPLGRRVAGPPRRGVYFVIPER
jgi:hypothetical protein